MLSPIPLHLQHRFAEQTFKIYVTMKKKAISEPKTDPNTPMMEIDWIRFYTNSTYSDEGVTYWANAGQLFY